MPTLGNSTQTSNLPAITDFTPSVGLDLKWHPSQDLTLDATINPDFAQVEADQLVLNLTSYETYYPEKRPFFLEGAELYNGLFPVVYTRRIGRVPPPPTLRPGESLLDVPQPTTIYGASKLSGTIAPGWTVATIQALTAPATVPVSQPDGSRGHARRCAPVGVERPSACGASSATRRPSGSSPPASRAARAPATGPPPPPGRPAHELRRSPCAPPRCRPRTAPCSCARARAASTTRTSPPWTRGGARTTAPDTFLVQGAASTLQRGPPRYVPDGTVINGGDGGVGAAGYFAKEGGDHWVGSLQGGIADRKFDNNDLGYNQRANIGFGGGAIEYRTLTPSGMLLETHTRIEAQETPQPVGARPRQRREPQHGGQARQLLALLPRGPLAQPTRLDDREVGDGTALERAATLVGDDMNIQTDPTTSSRSTSSPAPTPRRRRLRPLRVEPASPCGRSPQLDLDVLPTFTRTSASPAT